MSMEEMFSGRVKVITRAQATEIMRFHLEQAERMFFWGASRDVAVFGLHAGQFASVRDLLYDPLVLDLLDITQPTNLAATFYHCFGAVMQEPLLLQTIERRKRQNYSRLPDGELVEPMSALFGHSVELDTKATMAVAMLVLPDMVRREQLQVSASLITPPGRFEAASRAVASQLVTVSSKVRYVHAKCSKLHAKLSRSQPVRIIAQTLIAAAVASSSLFGTDRVQVQIAPIVVALMLGPVVWAAWQALRRSVRKVSSVMSSAATKVRASLSPAKPNKPRLPSWASAVHVPMRLTPRYGSEVRPDVGRECLAVVRMEAISRYDPLLELVDKLERDTGVNVKRLMNNRLVARLFFDRDGAAETAHGLAHEREGGYKRLLVRGPQVSFVEQGMRASAEEWDAYHLACEVAGVELKNKAAAAEMYRALEARMHQASEQASVVNASIASGNIVAAPAPSSAAPPTPSPPAAAAPASSATNPTASTSVAAPAPSSPAPPLTFAPSPPAASAPASSATNPTASTSVPASMQHVEVKVMHEQGDWNEPWCRPDLNGRAPLLSPRAPIEATLPLFCVDPTRVADAPPFPRPLPENGGAVWVSERPKQGWLSGDVRSVRWMAEVQIEFRQRSEMWPERARGVQSGSASPAAVGNSKAKGTGPPADQQRALNLFNPPGGLTWTDVLGPVYQGRTASGSANYEQEMARWVQGGSVGNPPRKPTQRGGAMRQEQSERAVIAMCKHDIVQQNQMIEQIDKALGKQTNPKQASCVFEVVSVRQVLTGSARVQRQVLQDFKRRVELADETEDELHDHATASVYDW